MSEKYDVAVIGGGHNGLVTASYLAKAGRSVIVLEKKGILGGIAITEEFAKGFKASSLADESDSFSPKIRNDLSLSRFGLKILPADALVFAPQPDGRNLTIWNDIDRTSREIASFSLNDAEAYPSFIKKMRKITRIITVINHMALPNMPDVGLGDFLGALKLIKPVRNLGWKNITHMMRILPLSISDLLSEWFESDVVKGAIAASALINISLGPQESGTAYSFLQNFSCSNNGLFRSGGQIKGGLGSLTHSLAEAARGYGAEIRTHSEVSKIVIHKGKITGIMLSDGKIISTPTIVSSADMKTTFENLIDPVCLDQNVLKKVQNITYNGTMARIHYSLNALPAFTGLSTDNEQDRLRSHIQIAPTLTDLQKAFDPVKYGQFTEKPYLDIRIPTLNDPSLAPAGKHIMSVTVKYMPYHLREGNWKELSDTLNKLVIKTIIKYAPDFQTCAEMNHVITPADMEKQYNLPEGSVTHGDITLDQSLWMRPVPGYSKYNSPIKGLYLCGAGTHPGSGITGINGLNAAQMILKSKNQ